MTSVRKNFGYQIIYRLLTIITPLITSPILSRALGAENLGIYSATQAYVNYFTLFAMLGIENYGNRTISALRDDEKARQQCFWNVYAVQFSSVCVVTIIYLLSFAFISDDRKLISLFQGLWMISCLLDINWFFFGCEQFKLTVTRNVIVKALSVICIVLFVRDQSDLLLYTIIMSGSMAVSQLMLWGSLPQYVRFEKPNWKEAKAHIIPILKLFIPVIGLSVFHIMDKTMLDLLSDEANVGFYYSADKVINIPLGVISAISTVMLPRISYMVIRDSKEEVQKMIAKSSEVVSFLTAAIGCGIAAIAKEFVPLFFGNGFEPCVPLIYCFVPVLFIKAWGELVRSQYLIPTKRDKLYTSAVFYGAITNLIANYLLITKFDALGAVLGTMFAEGVVMIVEMYGVKKDINFFTLMFHQTQYVLFGFLMYIVVRVFAANVPLSGWLQVAAMILVGGIVFLSFCGAFGIILKKGVFYETIMKIIDRKREMSDNIE